MAYLIHNDTQTTPLHSDIEHTLYISVQNCSEDLQDLYRTNALKHNENMYHDDFPDSGFDVFVPNEQILSSTRVNKVDLFIKCEMVHHVNRENIPTGFYMYPR